jgi:hypothetical protein
MQLYARPDQVTSPEIERGRALSQKVHPQVLLTDTLSILERNSSRTETFLVFYVVFGYYHLGVPVAVVPASSRAKKQVAQLLAFDLPPDGIRAGSRGRGRAWRMSKNRSAFKLSTDCSASSNPSSREFADADGGPPQIRLSACSHKLQKKTLISEA